MLHANGFITAGTLAAVITLAACYKVLDEIDNAATKTPEPAAEPICETDAGALRHLSDALGTHVVWRHQLAEPDEHLAQNVRHAADEATGEVREKLLELADSAQRSALEFLVGYNLAAGAWERRSGLTLDSPVLVRMDA